jgi:hypothetical protein
MAIPVGKIGTIFAKGTAGAGPEKRQIFGAGNEKQVRLEVATMAE